MNASSHYRIMTIVECDLPSLTRGISCLRQFLFFSCCVRRRNKVIKVRRKNLFSSQIPKGRSSVTVGNSTALRKKSSVIWKGQAGPLIIETLFQCIEQIPYLSSHDTRHSIVIVGDDWENTIVDVPRVRKNIFNVTTFHPNAVVRR